LGRIICKGLPVLAPREIDEYLLPTERRVIRVRRHWAFMAVDMIQTALVLLVVVVVQRLLPDTVIGDNVMFYVVLVAVLRFTAFTILWWIEKLIVTDKRVILAEGFILHKVGMMPISKVTDLTFERSLGGRMFGYGTVIVESAGQIQALNRIDYLPRPEEVYEALSELVFGEKGKTRASGMLSRPRWRR